MPHDVVAVELDEGDVPNAGEHAAGRVKAGGAAKVSLGCVASHHELGAKAQAREEHLHLLGGGVLCLVEDDEGVVQGAPAHEGQGRYLDDALLDEGVSALHVGHVKEGVVERPHVGVELLLERAGEKPEGLAGLDHRAREDDAADLLALEGRHRHGHGQVGLARASGADAEGDGAPADGVDVALLAGRLGPQGPSAVGEQDVVGEEVGPLGAVADLVHQEVDVGRLGALPRLDEPDEAREDLRHEVDLLGRARDQHLVSTHGDKRLEGGLHAPEVGVGGPHEARGVYGVGNAESDARGLHVPPWSDDAGATRQLR